MYGYSWSEGFYDFLLLDVRASTIHQYESIWREFSIYFKLFLPPSITEYMIFKFLFYYFQDLQLATSTFKSYKPALVPIFKETFHIDIVEMRFEILFKSFDLK